MKVMTAGIPNTGVPFSRAEYDRRHAAVLRQFEGAGIDALCVTANTHLQYLTGYSGWGTYFGPYPLVLVPGKSPVFVVRTYDEDAVRSESWIEEVVPYRQRGDQAKVWADVLRGLGLEASRVGLELDSWNLAPADVMSLQAKLPGITVVDATKIVPAVAAVKSDAEIEVMRQSMALTKAAVQTFNRSIREGASELDVWVTMSAEAAAAGGTLAPSSTLVFGARSALPHGTPSTYRLQRNQPAFVEVAGGRARLSGWIVPHGRPRPALWRRGSLLGGRGCSPCRHRRHSPRRHRRRRRRREPACHRAGRTR